MRIIIVFSSPNHEEFDEIWQPLINKDLGYIPANGSGDKIYAFDGHEDSYRANGVWMTENLIDEINKIIEGNNNCECACILHDFVIPDRLASSFTDIRFKGYSSVGSTFYDVYVSSFANGNIQDCFSRLWDNLHENETVTENLEALSSACEGYSERENNRDMLAAGFGNGINESFEDTDVCNELQAKGIGPTDGKYINIKSLFCHIKKDSVNTEIIAAATSSLSDIL
ncbi:MAG: hypothetical protein ACUZ8N_08235 [Candidatus Scalindua sp.]